jgi:hypothetical protein
LDHAAGNPKNIEEILLQLLKEKAIAVHEGQVIILADDLGKVGRLCS